MSKYFTAGPGIEDSLVSSLKSSKLMKVHPHSEKCFLRNIKTGTSLVVQWLKNPPSNAGDAGLIPGQGTKIPNAARQLSPHAATTELERLN